ncbi:MAG: hypothetical protein R3C05_03570 [Pirellulaceae bacterium]
MAAPSVLLITSTQAVGYSPGKGGRLTVLPADAAGDIGLSAEALLAAMPGHQKQVYVLTTEVWSQAVTVESRSLRRIDKAQVPQMLAYEAETYSGLPAGSARTAIQLLEAGPLETTYWVSQIDSLRFAQAADAIAFNGGKLLGVLHPAGLPDPITMAKGEWTRLEQWDDAMVVVSRKGRSGVERRFLSEVDEAIESPAAARDFLNRSNVDTGAYVELLRQSATISAETLRSDEEFVDSIDLTNEHDLKTFLAAWSRALRSPKELPVVVPVRTGASAQTKRTLALAALAAVIVGIAAHHRLSTSYNESRVETLKTQIAELQAPIEAFAAQQKQISNVETEVIETQDQIAQLQSRLLRYQGQLGVHRSRMAEFLRTLGEFRPRDLMLSEVQSDGGELRVIGRSVRPEAIIEFATAIAKQLEPLNLSVRVPRREALLVTADGGPYEFEYIISDGA